MFVVHLKERRLFFLALLDHEIASGVKFTSNGQSHRIRDLTRNGGKSLLPLVEVRDRVDESLRVGMAQLPQNRLNRASFHYPACVHHHDLICHL
jgi:hypothetical protein